MAWENTDYYFSGQGVVLLGDRDSSGNPAGLSPVGNVSSLKITVTTSVLEHKESKSGQRAIDLRLTTETKAALSLTVENFNSRNLADSLRGSFTQKSGAAIVAEAIKGYWGKITPLNNMKVSAVAVKRGATTLSAYVNDATPYDYKLNADNGSIMLNDGSATALTANATTGGLVPTNVAVGATTSITVTAPTIAVGQYVAVSGFAGADAAVLNAKAHRVATNSGTVITVETDTLGKTITVGTPLLVADGGALTVDYTYAGQFLVDPLTLGAPEKWMRFEGLNTADNNAPVTVDIFRFLTDPLKELMLIGDTVNNFVLDGNVLADSGRTSGSKFWRQMMVR
jgi:hypothetical protein